MWRDIAVRDRPQWKNVDVKSVIIRRKNNGNNNNNINDNDDDNSNTNKKQ